MHAHGQLTHIVDVHECVVGVEARVEQGYVQKTHRLDHVRVVVVNELVTEGLESGTLLWINYALRIAYVKSPHDVGWILDAFTKCAANRERRVDGHVVE